MLPKDQIEHIKTDRLPLLSIIIPSLDADTELRRCVDSIRLACRQSDVEVVVVAPGRRVDAVQELLPDAVVVAETRRGIYGAMNDGIQASRGRYLYFMGKDDILLAQLPSVIETRLAASPSAVFFDVYWGSDGIYSGRPSRWRLLVRNLCHQGVVYSREAIVAHGPYMRRMKVQADHLLNIKLLWDRGLRSRVQYVAEPLAWYSGAGFSAAARDPVFRRIYPAVLRRYVGMWAAWLVVVSRCLRGRRQ
jgi:glycosyltransferase involved in cell wall biosynthesis